LPRAPTSTFFSNNPSIKSFPLLSVNPDLLPISYRSPQKEKKKKDNQQRDLHLLAVKPKRIERASDETATAQQVLATIFIVPAMLLAALALWPFVFVLAPAFEFLALFLAVVVVFDIDLVAIAMLGDGDVDAGGDEASKEKSGKDG
jgi:hypothetical protein